MKIDSLGNIYIQSLLNELELSYLNAFSNSVHFDNPSNELLGLYDISVLQKDIENMNFVFDPGVDLRRSLETNYDKETFSSVFFPFFKSPLSFTEKSIKFFTPEIKNSEEFLFFINHIAQSLMFYFNHFFSQNCYSKILNKQFFEFFSTHSISGNIYFKLSEYGHIYRLTCYNNHVSLYCGFYPTSVHGKPYKINSKESYDVFTKKKLESIYNKISIIEIKNNAIFEEMDTIFSFQHSETLEKMIQFHTLNSKFQVKSKNKINKI